MQKEPMTENKRTLVTIIGALVLIIIWNQIEIAGLVRQLEVLR